jgi:hypothetical protein
MRFEFYSERLAGRDPVSVDGIVPGAGLHLSHWSGNRTPAALKADTSTGIALRFVTSPDRDELARGAEVASNNHFDADGVLSVWTVLSGAQAAEHGALLVAAAEAGDFSAHPGREGLKVALALHGADGGSPLAAHVRGAPVSSDEEAYELALPLVGELVARPDRFEPLWRDGVARIDAAMESFAGGRSVVDEDAGRLVSAVRLDPALDREAARHAISHHARGRMYLVATPAAGGGWSYRIEWPYWTWAETVERPRIARLDLEPVARQLRALDPAASWQVERGELSPGISCASTRAAPDAVAAEVRSVLA